MSGKITKSLFLILIVLTSCKEITIRQVGDASYTISPYRPEPILIDPVYPEPVEPKFKTLRVGINNATYVEMKNNWSNSIQKYIVLVVEPNYLCDVELGKVEIDVNVDREYGNINIKAHQNVIKEWNNGEEYACAAIYPMPMIMYQRLDNLNYQGFKVMSDHYADFEQFQIRGDLQNDKSASYKTVFFERIQDVKKLSYYLSDYFNQAEDLKEDDYYIWSQYRQVQTEAYAANCLDIAKSGDNSNCMHIDPATIIRDLPRLSRGVVDY